MKSLKFTSIAIAALSIVAFAAHADDSQAPKTRAQVRAETAEAIRTGDIPSGFEGLRMNELLPTMYKKTPARKPVATQAVEAPVASNADAVIAASGNAPLSK